MAMNFKPEHYEIRIHVNMGGNILHFYIDQETAELVVGRNYGINDPGDFMVELAKGNYTHISAYSSETHRAVILSQELLSKHSVYELVELDENCEEI